MGNANTQTEAVTANIRAELARRRISQRSVAEHLGISQPSLSLRLSGQTEMKLRDLIAISDFIGVHPADLLTPAAASPGVGGPALPGG